MPDKNLFSFFKPQESYIKGIFFLDEGKIEMFQKINEKYPDTLFWGARFRSIMAFKKGFFLDIFSKKGKNNSDRSFVLSINIVIFFIINKMLPKSPYYLQ